MTRPPLTMRGEPHPFQAKVTLVGYIEHNMKANSQSS
jgi:hypothetical protein